MLIDRCAADAICEYSRSALLVDGVIGERVEASLGAGAETADGSEDAVVFPAAVSAEARTRRRRRARQGPERGVNIPV